METSDGPSTEKTMVIRLGKIPLVAADQGVRRRSTESIPPVCM